jgi:hypothetical protein
MPAIKAERKYAKYISWLPRQALGLLLSGGTCCPAMSSLTLISPEQPAPKLVAKTCQRLLFFTERAPIDPWRPDSCSGGYFVNKLLSVFLGVMGAGLIAMGLPVHDMMVGQAWVQGGLLPIVLFLAVLLIGGLVLLVVAVHTWRRQ